MTQKSSAKSVVRVKLYTHPALSTADSAGLAALPCVCAWRAVVGSLSEMSWLGIGRCQQPREARRASAKAWQGKGAGWRQAGGDN